MDKEVFELINKIADEHSSKTFGYLDKNDLKNEIWLIVLEKINEFDKTRGNLEHFLRVLVRNRLVNKFKDITKSVRPPCPRCPYYDPNNSPSDCARFGDDRHLCSKWRNYQLSVDSRNSLLNSVEQQFDRFSTDNILDRMIGAEIKEKIRSKIDKEYCRDLDQLLSGGKISKQRLKKLKIELIRILNQDVGKKEELISVVIEKKLIKSPKKKKKRKRVKNAISYTTKE